MGCWYLHRGGLTADQMTTSGHDRKRTPPTERATIPPLTRLGCTVLTRRASLWGRSTGNGMLTSVWPGDRHRKCSAGPQRTNRKTWAAVISIEVAWPLVRWPLPVMTGSGLPQRMEPLFRLLHDWGAQFWPGGPPCEEGRPEMECPLLSDLETGTGSPVPDRREQTVRLGLLISPSRWPDRWSDDHFRSWPEADSPNGWNHYSASYMIGVHSFDQEGLPVRKVDRKWNAHFRLTWRQAPEVQCRTAKNKP